MLNHPHLALEIYLWDFYISGIKNDYLSSAFNEVDFLACESGDLKMSQYFK
jgi:hypothetical protein